MATTIVRNVMIDKPDIVIVIYDSYVYKLFVKGEDLTATIIDLDTGDIGDSRDYEFVRKDKEYNEIEI